MKRNIISGCFILTIVIFAGCHQEDKVHKPITKSNSVPSPVSNVKVKPLPGAVEISYDVPHKENILLVKAVLIKKVGSKVVETSSYYNNEITLKGFPDTTTYNVKLYTVNRANNESDPVNVKVKPLEPPILNIFNSLKLSKDFGGVRIEFKNQYKTNVKIGVITKDSVGNFEEVGAYYTGEPDGAFNVHGFLPKERKFGAYVRDQWQNYSDTVYKTVTPIFEEEIPKSGFSEVHLPTDTWTQNPCCSSGFINLWDGITHTADNIFVTQEGTSFPQWFTIDMGGKAKIDRFKVYSRYDPAGAGAYTQDDPQVFELWGSLDPNPDGSFDSTWVKLGSFEAKKPSGLPGDEYTAEDVAYASEGGQEYQVQNPVEKPPVRYIRFKTIETWTKQHANGVVINELTFWGQLVN